MSTEAVALLFALTLVGHLVLLVLLLAARAEQARLRWHCRHLEGELAHRDRELSCLTGGVSDEVCWATARRLAAMLSHRDGELNTMRRELARLERELDEQGCKGRT